MILSSRARFLKIKTGFTLIELLIVLVIIGIVVTFVTINVKVNQIKRLESLSQQIADLLRLAQEEALLRPATLGFSVTSNAYQFYEFRQHQWQILTEAPLKKRPLPNDIFMKLRLTVSTEDKPSHSQKVMIFPSGDLTPFSILVKRKHSDQPVFMIQGEANGEIKVKRSHAP